MLNLGTNVTELILAVLVDGVGHQVVIERSVLAILLVDSDVGLAVDAVNNNLGDQGSVGNAHEISIIGDLTIVVVSPNAVDNNVGSVGGVVIHTDDVAVGIIVEGIGLAESDLLVTIALSKRVQGSLESGVDILISNSDDVLSVLGGLSSDLVALQAGQLSDLALGSFHGSNIAIIIGDEDVIVLGEAGGLEAVGDNLGGDIAILVGFSAVNGNVDGSLDLDVVVLVLDFLDHLGDLGEIGVDVDDGIIIAIRIDLGELALSAGLGLGIGGLVGSGDSLLGGINDLDAVDPLLNSRGFLLLAQILAEIASGNSLGVSGNGLVVDGGGLVAAVVGPLGSRTAIGAVGGVGGQVEVLVTEGLVVLKELAVSLGAAEAHGLIAERGGVGDHGSLGDRAEQQLRDELTGGGSVEVNALDVLQNASLLSVLSDVESPVSASELTVLVVTDSTEDHGEDFIARDVAGGLEGAVGIALDELSVGAVADVTGSPASAGHVAELVVRSVQARLVVLGEILSVDTIDDRSHLSAGDVALGLEGTVLITLEHTHAVQDGDGFGIIRRNLIGILESGVGADGQRQSHDQSQHHCE